MTILNTTSHTIGFNTEFSGCADGRDCWGYMRQVLTPMTLFEQEASQP